MALASLAQKAECQTWHQRSQVQSSQEVKFCCWNFLFSPGKASGANFANFANITNVQFRVVCENPECITTSRSA